MYQDRADTKAYDFIARYNMTAQEKREDIAFDREADKDAYDPDLSPAALLRDCKKSIPENIARMSNLGNGPEGPQGQQGEPLLQP